MKNDYRIDGEVTTLFIHRKDGTTLECLIDTEDILKVGEFRWYVSVKNPTPTNKGYKRAQAYLGRVNGKQQHLFLARFLLNASSDIEVDHFNGNTLDNRKCNLRALPVGVNQQNRQAANINNASGIRGVTWDRRQKKWRAMVFVNGKNKHIGFFRTVDAASIAVKECRALYMPYSTDAAEVLQ